MAQQIIGAGTVSDDHTGDSVRTAFTKTNSNFTELYGKTGQRGQTYVFAAYDSYGASTSGADVVCNGPNGGSPNTDDVAINAKLTAMTTGGKIIFLQGTYCLSNPIVPYHDWTTLEGEAHPHWSVYNGGYPTHDKFGTPGGSKFIQTVSGKQGIAVDTTNYSQWGSAARHNGLCFRRLYIASQSSPTGTGYYNATGLYDPGGTDMSLIDECSFQGWATAIDIAWDTGTIVHCSIQDNAGGVLLETGSIYIKMHNNIIFDCLGAPAIWSKGRFSIISGNIIGDITAGNSDTGIPTAGIDLWGAGHIVSGNQFQAIFGGVVIGSTADESVIIGNMIYQTYSSAPLGGDATGYSCIQIGSSGYAPRSNIVKGNIIHNDASVNLASSTYAVDFTHTTYSVCIGNIIGRAGVSKWNGGGANTNIAGSGGTGNIFSANPGQQ